MLDYPDVPQMRRQIVINCHALGYQNITIFKENPNMGRHGTTQSADVNIQKRPCKSCTSVLRVSAW